ncbi:unnamed protein product [Urochloa decumbens]|uniref:Uncharacterized protein n=1 Tax=Urochloa decumbens TaxID=240449 RepID=A0ABC9BSF1_9POAL
MAVSVARPAAEEDAARKKKKRSSILGSLREAIKKVRFLLSFSATRWMLLTSVGARGAAAPGTRRALSFNARPGLLDLDVEGGGITSPASSRTSRSASMGTATTRSLSRTSSAASPPPQVLTRTSSGASPASSSGSPGDPDIDRRAEQFIANFYKQLQMERQVSLQLRYVRGNSWDRSP